jgi:hypothetical protein
VRIFSGWNIDKVYALGVVQYIARLSFVLTWERPNTAGTQDAQDAILIKFSSN